MPSSLVFAALVVAWLVVLVPMTARRRQAVSRTADRELAARVVCRPGRPRRPEEVEDVGNERTSAEPELCSQGRAAGTEACSQGRGITTEPGHDDAPTDEAPTEDAPADDAERPEAPIDEAPADDAERPDTSRPVPAMRPYRAGRGGFDPEAAALAARARYVYRQRVVIALLAVAGLSAVGATVLSTSMWWVQAGADVVTVGYLAYLRRQVRIEAEVRERRAARMAGVQSTASRPDPHAAGEGPAVPEPLPPAADDPAAVSRPVDAMVVESDDDPAFHDLADRRHPAYRRAVGE